MYLAEQKAMVTKIESEMLHFLWRAQYANGIYHKFEKNKKK